MSALEKETAFTALVEQYQHRVFGLSLMILRNRAAAEEVTQDAFVRAFLNLDKYDPARPFYPWIAAIAVRLAQTWLRRRVQRALPDDGALDAASDTDGPLRELISDERSRKLWSLVTSLRRAQSAARRPKRSPVSLTWMTCGAWVRLPTAS